MPVNHCMVFLSYRRDDSGGYTELLFARLTARYGRDTIFRDVHVIVPGDQFREVIREAIVASGVMCIVISKQWLSIADASGAARIAALDDVVKWEIQTALRERVPIVPVLVGGATMPRAHELPEGIRELASATAHEISDQRWESDFESLIEIVDRFASPADAPVLDVNPFGVRAAIRDDAHFFDRLQERTTLRDYLRVRQNCQLVGPRRIGKSSLLLFIQRHSDQWGPTASVAWIDLQDPRCYTLKGWLREVAEGFRLPGPVGTLSDLMEGVEDMIAAGAHPILCLDEFGEMARRHSEFTRETFLTLRACGQRGMSILTAAPKRLSELTDPNDDTSPFFNTFPILRVPAFSKVDSQAFVDLVRPGTPQFAETEKERILEFAQGQPLALQSACYHVVSARRTGEPIREALNRAAEDCGRIFG
jgi:TIR domain